MLSRTAALAAALLASAASPVWADGLIDNVNGMTLDAKGKVVSFTGLVIDNDGKVKQLLERRDKRPEKLDYKLDGDGRTLMPGIIDAHGHVMGLGFSLLTLDLSGTKSLEEALAKIKAYADEIPAARGSSGADGTRRNGVWAAFPPLPISTQSCPIARSGSKGSTAMPAGRTPPR